MTQDTTTTGIAIPEDVMEAARDVVSWHLEPAPYQIVADVARAIMAERARCRAELFGDEEKPRYTTKRMRTEVAKAKAYGRVQALEDAASAIDALAKIAMKDFR